jgi:F-type H+-transporting ATPase subunit epsilon
MSTALNFNFELVTPERTVLQADLTQLSVPTTSGELTILAHHLPLVTIIKAGVIELKKIDGQLEVLAVSGGILEVMLNKVVLLADTAERAQELDEAKIKEARLLAENLKQAKEVDLSVITGLIEKELARDKAVRRWKKLRNIETIN